MNKKSLRRIFPLIAILLLAPWPVAYGFENAEAGQDTIQVTVAEASTQPTWTTFGNAIGGVDTPGDLFSIDATDNPTDIQVTLHITNTSELVHNYRYLTLKVGVYTETGEDEWEKAPGVNGEPTPDTFITLRNGQVSFALSGYSNYKVSIDSGSFKTHPSTADNGSGSPKFYLEVE